MTSRYAVTRPAGSTRPDLEKWEEALAVKLVGMMISDPSLKISLTMANEAQVKRIFGKVTQKLAELGWEMEG